MKFIYSILTVALGIVMLPFSLAGFITWMAVKFFALGAMAADDLVDKLREKV